MLYGEVEWDYIPNACPRLSWTKKLQVVRTVKLSSLRLGKMAANAGILVKFFIIQINYKKYPDSSHSLLNEATLTTKNLFKCFTSNLECQYG